MTEKETIETAKFWRFIGLNRKLKPVKITVKFEAEHDSSINGFASINIGTNEGRKVMQELLDALDEKNNELIRES